MADFLDFEAPSNTDTSNDDPVADFLAREKAEFEKIENNAFDNDDFGSFCKFVTIMTIISLLNLVLSLKQQTWSQAAQMP